MLSILVVFIRINIMHMWVELECIRGFKLHHLAQIVKSLGSGLDIPLTEPTRTPTYKNLRVCNTLNFLFTNSKVVDFTLAAHAEHQVLQDWQRALKLPRQPINELHLP